MKAVTILVIIALMIQLVWTVASQFIYTVLNETMDINYAIMGWVWVVVNMLVGISFIAFFITFMSQYDKIINALQQRD